MRAARELGRAASTLSRLTGRGSGGVIGGRVILAVAPGAARDLATDHEVTLVSGTNGKTTTTALVAAALRTLGAVDSNADGANTAAGLTYALARAHARRVVLETDEGWLPWAVSQLVPATVLLLNLSRDQLSRHHEVAMVSTQWRQALAGVQTAVANVDDPHTVWAAHAAPRQVWVAAGQRWTQDSVTCPGCGEQLRRDGVEWSSECGFRRPAPDWWLEGDDLVCAGRRFHLELSVPGRFNRANAAMALAAAASRGADPVAALAAVHEVHSAAGRYARYDVAGHEVRLLLAKNPAGWLELLDLVRGSDRPVVIAFNSEGVDGRDPSWLYDVPFDQLAGREVAVVGRRATDVRVRLAMAGVGTRAPASGLVAALGQLPPGPVEVLCNYTAFQDARRELAHVGG